MRPIKTYRSSIQSFTTACGRVEAETRIVAQSVLHSVLVIECSMWCMHISSVQQMFETQSKGFLSLYISPFVKLVWSLSRCDSCSFECTSSNGSLSSGRAGSSVRHSKHPLEWDSTQENLVFVSHSDLDEWAGNSPVCDRATTALHRNTTSSMYSRWRVQPKPWTL